MPAYVVGQQKFYQLHLPARRQDSERGCGVKVIQLDHPTDPRFLIVEGDLPDRITVDDLAAQRYGKPLLASPNGLAAIYTQPKGPGTDWIRPSALAKLAK